MIVRVRKVLEDMLAQPKPSRSPRKGKAAPRRVRRSRS